MINSFFFFIFSFLLLFILFHPNPIHCLLALIILFINYSFLLFYWNAPFLALSYILVYIGAICVLFLYFILLLKISSFSTEKKYKIFIFYFLGFFFEGLLLYFFFPPSITFSFSNFLPEGVTDLSIFGFFLYNSFFLYLIYSMFFLFIAILLAIFLSLGFIKKTKTKKIKFYQRKHHVSKSNLFSNL